MRFALLLVLGFAANLHAYDLTPPRACRQMLVVETPAWASVDGLLQRYMRAAKNAPWQKVGAPIPIVVGRNGLAWGLGEHGEPPERARWKREGDNCGPAGLFALPSAFGYEAASPGLKLRYTQVTPQWEAIDDPNSLYYNQIVNRGKVFRVDWRSSEKMRRDDELYRLGIVVAHNPEGVPGAGSCIFLHVWRGTGQGTAGCTAMSGEAIAEVQRWLDPAQKPSLLQLPRELMPEPFRMAGR